MRIIYFTHSLLSDWNHGNAHFLRGVLTELKAQGHDVQAYEPAGSWSAENQRKDGGAEAAAGFRAAYPNLSSREYDAATLDLDAALADADLVLVHEWNDPALVKRVGEHRAERGGYKLLFHDTHHRAVTDAGGMAAYDLQHYDGVLAFGAVIRDLYLSRGWADRKSVV